jgi:hypothetical protein
MLPAGDDDSNADSDLVASLLLQRRRKQLHKSSVQALLLDEPCVGAPPLGAKQLSAHDFEKQVRFTGIWDDFFVTGFCIHVDHFGPCRP